MPGFASMVRLIEAMEDFPEIVGEEKGAEK
jgi:hypothetical protein